MRRGSVLCLVLLRFCYIYGFVSFVQHIMSSLKVRMAESPSSADRWAGPRIGHGFDIHQLSEEATRPLVVAGVTLQHSKGTVAHSDGDTVFHSIVDAILGALGKPDIGELFPDSDPKWDGADSSAFMNEAYNIMRAQSYEVGNLDVTLILQSPKVKTLKPQMRANIARLLRAPMDRVNIKARTHEMMDSIGEGRACACHAVVLLLPTGS